MNTCATGYAKGPEKPKTVSPIKQALENCISLINTLDCSIHDLNDQLLPVMGDVDKENGPQEKIDISYTSADRVVCDLEYILNSLQSMDIHINSIRNRLHI